MPDNRDAAINKSVLLLSDNNIASGNRYLMSSLKEKLIPANLVFYKFDHNNNIGLLLELIQNLNVGIIAISLFSTRRLEFEAIANRIKSMFPDIVIVCGGPDVNSNYLNVINWADYVCLADGEVAFPTLCNELLLKKTAKEAITTPNIYFKSGGRVIRNQIEIEMNLDKYSFPWFSDENIFEISFGKISPHKDSLSKVYNVYASRGCPYKCSYCANHVFSKNFPNGKNYRYRSVDNVINEILSVTAKMPSLQSIAFHDEQFGGNSKWFEKFTATYKERINMPFFVQMNPKGITRENIRKLKDIGLVSMSFGVQSGSEKIRKIYARPESLEQIRTANHILNELRVSHFFDIIVDNPLENQEDLFATFRFLLSLKKPFVAKTFDLVHLPNTELTEMLLKNNNITHSQIEGNFSYKDDISWRVRDKDIRHLVTDDKYIVALIQMTGNMFLPNMALKTLALLMGYVPKIFKKTLVKIVLSNWYSKNYMVLNAAVSIVRDKGCITLFGKILRKVRSIAV